MPDLCYLIRSGSDSCLLKGTAVPKLHVLTVLGFGSWSSAVNTPSMQSKAVDNSLGGHDLGCLWFLCLLQWLQPPFLTSNLPSHNWGCVSQQCEWNALIWCHDFAQQRSSKLLEFLGVYSRSENTLYSACRWLYVGPFFARQRPLEMFVFTNGCALLSPCRCIVCPLARSSFLHSQVLWAWPFSPQCSYNSHHWLFKCAFSSN